LIAVGMIGVERVPQAASTSSAASVIHDKTRIRVNRSKHTRIN